MRLREYRILRAKGWHRIDALIAAMRPVGPRRAGQLKRRG